MTRSLDTNILIRWIVRDNPSLTEQVDALLSSGKTFHVADMAVNEFAYVLSKFYKLSDEIVVGCVRKIVDHKAINCNRALFSRVISDFVDSPKISFVDTCLAHYAALQGGRLITFDKTLANTHPKATELLQ